MLRLYGDSVGGFVKMPDMFVSFLAIEPQINPNYETAKKESEDWFAKQCQYDAKAYKKLVRADFPYIVGILARDARVEEFRTICDYVNWAFSFDDMFDEGCLKKDTEQTAIQIENLVNVMRANVSSPSVSEDDPLLQVFESVWHRFAKRSSEGARKRFIEAVVGYTEGVTSQVKIVSLDEQLEEEQYLAIRRKSGGVAALFAFIEYSYGLDLPDDIFDHPSMQKLDIIAKDLIIIQNDALSFSKDLADGVDQNIVALFGRRGFSPQEAYDKIDVLLKGLYAQWYFAQAGLPQWSETIDRQVQKYIRAMQDAVTANLYWSFRTARYFGKQTDYIRRTRLIAVPSDQLIKNGLTLPRNMSPCARIVEPGLGSDDFSMKLDVARTEVPA